MDNQSSDYRHLSRLLYVEKTTLTTITFYVSDFNTPNAASTQLLIANNIQFGDWYYLYIGVDFTTSMYTIYLYFPKIPNQSQQFQTPGLAGQIVNEQLDERVKLYIGGSVDRPPSGAPISFNGVIYNAKFIPNFWVSKTSAIYALNDDSDKIYYFNLNQPCKTRIYSDYNQNMYSTFGSVDAFCPDASDANQPTFSIVNGLELANNQYMKLNLNNEFQNMNFISFWIYLNTLPAAGQTGTLFEIQNTSVIISILLKDDGFITVNSVGGSYTSIKVQLATAKWIKFYCNFAYHTILDNLMVSIMKDDQELEQNVKIAAFPTIRTTLQTIKLGGNQLDAKIMDIYGGQGSFLGTGELFLSKCISSVGITNPVCIYCQAGYYLSSGVCSLVCPDGYYRDTNARICRKCHQSCKTCIGALENQCTTCDANFPLLFNDYPILSQGFCLNQCPKGTSISSDGSNCVCHKTCNTCKLDPTDKVTVQCTQCIEYGQFIIGYKCVIAQLCPYGTYAATATNKCEASCVAGLFVIKDTVNRKCVDKCEIGTIKDKTGTSCLLNCPIGQFSKNVGGAANETPYQCADCDINCTTCIDQFDYCLSCKPNYLIHEYSGKCLQNIPPCQTGFYQDGSVCRVCQKGCTTCPQDFYLLDSDTCVLECPIEYQKQSLPTPICDPLLYPVVKIANLTQINDPDHEALPVGRQQDILINADYYFKGQISEILWYLSGDSEQYSEQFFSKTFNNVKDLIIPKDNLQPNTIYTLTIRVIASTGKYGEKTIFIQSSSEIVDGEYQVSPQIGISGVTEFSVFYSLWSHPKDTLLYDLSYSIETSINFRNQTNSFKNDLHQVFIASNTDGTVTFKFPPFKTDKIVELELYVYTSNEVKVKKISITLKKFQGDIISMESEVRRFEPSSSVTIEQYLDITYKMAYLYSTIQVEEANRLFKEEVLRQNQVYQLTSSFCSDDVSCRGQGVCGDNFYDPQMYQCTCDEDSSGDFCSWNEKVLKVINLLTYNIQIDLLDENRKITQNQLFAISQILRNIVSVSDGLSKKTFRFIMNMLNKLQAFVFPRTEIFSNIFQTIQEILYQAVTRPSLRPDERIKYTVRLREIIDSYIQKFSTQNIQLNVDYLFTFAHSNIYLTKQRGRELQNNPTNYGKFYTIPMERVITQIPFETFQYTDIITVQALEWNIDLIYPRPNSTSNHIELTLLANNKQLNIANLGQNKITHHFQKKAGFPPLRTDYTSHYFCGHLGSIDFTTTKWLYDSQCQYTFENEFYIRCECNQLDSAIALRGTIEYYQDFVPDSKTLAFYTSKHMDKKMKFFSTSFINFDSNIPIAFRPYASPDYPFSFVPFKWDSPAFILFVILIVVFIVFSIINLLRIRIKPPQEYVQSAKVMLLVTYHPFISMVMFGHTAKSHTYQMRLAKFFSILVGMLAMNAVAFEQIQISIPLINIKQRIVGSAFAAILLNASMNYFVEALYFIIKRHIYKEKRQELLYNGLFFFNMLGNAAFGTWCNGYTDKEDYGNFIVAFIISLVIDFFVFDIFVMSYAFYEVESNYLKFFAFRGFYITPADNLDKESYEIINYKKQKYIDINDQELERLKNIKNQQDDDLAGLDPAQAIDKAQGYDQISQNQRPLSGHSKKSQTSNKIFPSKANVP